MRFLLAEFANLITIPGRLRENGEPVPVQKADWNKYASRPQPLAAPNKK